MAGLQLTLAGLLFFLSAAPDETQTTGRPLHLNGKLAGDFRERSVQVYSLDLSAGDYAQVTVDQEGTDVVILVRSPLGEGMLEVDSPSDREGVEYVSLVAAQTGSYSLEVRRRSTAEPEAGGYEIELEARRPATEQDRLRAEAEQLTARSYLRYRQKRPEDLTEALNGYRQAIALWEKLEDPSRQAFTYYSMGLTHFIAKQPGEALAMLQNALSLWRSSGDSPGIAKTLHQIGRVHVLQGDSHSAIEAFRESISISRANGQPGKEAVSLGNLAELYNDLGNVSKAIDTYSQALSIHQSSGNAPGEARISVALGDVLAQQGRPNDALPHYEQCLRLGRQLNHPVIEAGALERLAALYERLGQPHKALEYLVPALEKYGEARNFASQGTTLVKLGSLLADLGDDEAANDALLRALPLLRDPRDEVRAKLVLSGLPTFEPAKATELAEQALAKSRELEYPLGVALAFQSLGFHRLRHGNPGQARDALLQAQQTFQEIDSLREQAKTLRGLGRAFSEASGISLPRTGTLSRLCGSPVPLATCRRKPGSFMKLPSPGNSEETSRLPGPSYERLLPSFGRFAPRSRATSCARHTSRPPGRSTIGRSTCSSSFGARMQTRLPERPRSRSPSGHGPWGSSNSWDNPSSISALLIPPCRRRSSGSAWK